MASNYPPGVTGNEYAIAGPQAEWEEWRECPFCGGSGMFPHEAHREFGVRAFCTNPIDACPGEQGFEVDYDGEAEYEPDLEDA